MDVLSGSVLTEDGIIRGYVCIEDGVVEYVEDGDPPEKPLATGLILPPMVNAHTHCADAGLKIPRGMTIEELVAPPNGLKHTYLRDLKEPELERSIREYADASRRNGIGTFIDFREGGEKGCCALRKAAPEATILGRPIGKEYDHNEVSGILDISDGIGISSLSDMDYGYIEQVADQTRERKKIFAIHASERIREDIDKVLSLDPSFIVHMVEATDSDLLKCAESEVPIVVCARSNAYFGKVPPIKRMMDCGVDVAIGTDNAMLCSPDMRSEAASFMNVLTSQGGLASDVSGPMFSNGRKILYTQNKVSVHAGMRADLTVLPYSGEFRMDGLLQNRGLIFRYEARRNKNEF
jgi:cytosine/adenosine deaminase-related metal-dependent hydrolase